MSVVTRLWEKLTGRPHQHHEANMVRAATSRLMRTNEEFSKLARVYVDAENPLEMLLRDALKRKPSGGQPNGSTKHRS